MVFKNVFAIRIFVLHSSTCFCKLCFCVDFPLHSFELPSWEWAHTVGKQSCINTPLELLGRWGGGGQNERGRDRVCQKRLEKKKEETVQHGSGQSRWTAVLWERRCQTHWRGTTEQLRTVKSWCLTYWWGPIKKKTEW